MTKQELNRDIKRLYNNIEKAKNTPSFFEYIDNNAKKEYTRLLNASDDFSALSKKSVLILYRLNLSYRFIPLHTFGLNAKI